MSYPQPKYTDSIDVSHMVYDQNGGSIEGDYMHMFKASVNAIRDYARKNWYLFPMTFPTPTLRDPYTTVETHGLSPSDIMVSLQYGTRMTGEGNVYSGLNIRLFSFRTPTDELKETLTDIVTEAIQKYQKPNKTIQ